MANSLYLAGSVCFMALASRAIERGGWRLDNVLPLLGASAFALGTIVNMIIG